MVRCSQAARRILGRSAHRLGRRSANKLRLGPLPKTDTVKLTIAPTEALKADLDRYATLHAQTYGGAVDAATPASHMLAAFMAQDRGFKKVVATEPLSRPTSHLGSKPEGR